MAVVSRLELDHPALGTPGGAALHTQIETIYQKIGDNMADRFFLIDDLLDTDSIDLDHNFNVAFGELRYDLYNVANVTTKELGDKITKLTTPAITDFTIAAKVGSEKTHITLTNNSGATRDLALLVYHDPIEFDELTDVDFSTPPEDGQAPVFDGITKSWKAGASGDSSFKFQSISTDGAALVIKGGSLALSDGRILYSASDLTHDVSSLAGSDGDWSGFIDLYSLGASSIVNNRRVYAITTANFVYIKNYTDDSTIDLSRYVPCGAFDRTGGVYSGLTTFPYRRYELPIGADDSLVDSLEFTTIGAVGDAGQLNSGHELVESSFPSAAIGANLSWYNLADMLDASGNARTLTNNGSATFGTGILGDANQAAVLNGSSQYLTSSDALFNPADNDFIAGGWFKPTSWSAGIQGLFGQWGAGGSRSFIVILDTGLLKIRATTDGTNASESSIDVSGLTGWHHVAIKYIASTNSFTLYVDGVSVANLTLSAGLASVAGTFTIGRNPDGATNYFNGSIDEFLFGVETFEDNDILKIQSAKYTHNKGLSPNAQGWEWWVKSTAGITRPLESNPIVDMQINELFFDLSAQETTNLVARKLFSLNQSGMAKPSRGQTLTLTTDQLDALLPLSHGLGVVPELSFKVSDGTDFLGQDWGSIFKVDATQIKIAGDSLVTLFGSGVDVILTYSSAIPVSFVPNRFWNVRRLSALASVNANDRVIADVTGGGFTLTLPASPSIGDEVQLLDGKGAFDLTDFVTFDRNGQPLRGGTDNFDCTQPNKLFRAIFVDETYGWDILY